MLFSTLCDKIKSIITNMCVEMKLYFTVEHHILKLLTAEIVTNPEQILSTAYNPLSLARSLKLEH